MKQGPSNNYYAPKREPVAHAIDPGAVSQIGVHEVNLIPQPLHAGRGFMAPAPVAEDHHPCGSQGKHK